MAFYQSIAPFYDFIFPPSRIQVRFIDEHLHGVRGKNILEAGCGTGNLALMLAEEGAIVEGIDLDGEMISRAQEKARNFSNTRFRELDILEISKAFIPGAFYGIVSFGNTLVHLQDADKMQCFFEAAYMLLKTGGKFLLQVINYDRILDQRLKGLPPIDNEKIQFERNYDYSENDNQIDFRTILTIKETGHTILNNVKLTPFRQDQIKNALWQAGFRRIEAFSNFMGEEFHTDSVPLVMTGMKE